MSDVYVLKKEHSWCFQPIICSCAEFPLYKYTHQPRFLKSVGVCIQRQTTWFNKPAKTIFAGKLYMASAFWLYNKTSLCSLESTEKKILTLCIRLRRLEGENSCFHCDSIYMNILDWLLPLPSGCVQIGKIYLRIMRFTRRSKRASWGNEHR